MKVGILGGGQLAQLLGQAAPALGIELFAYTPRADDPACKTATCVTGTLQEKKKLEAFANRVDVISLENENIPTQVIQDLQGVVPVYPGPAALACAADRLNEKSTAKKLAVPCGPYFSVDTLTDLQRAMDHLNGPAVLKTRRFGYDGKGQWRLKPGDDYSHIFHQTGGQPCILEEMVDFTCECSLLAVRSVNHQVCFYPLIHNVHEQGILRRSWIGDFSSDLQEKAQQYATSFMEHLDYVGVLALEFFLTAQGELWFNEMAPRVHNSGHLTTEACNVSQFESHLRAVCNMPLREVEVVQKELFMLNVIGEAPNPAPQHKDALVRVYDYCKAPRPGRKCGHLIYKT